MTLIDITITLAILMIVCSAGIWVDTQLYYSALEKLAMTEAVILEEELKFLHKSFDGRY
jgi:hypothetical protein